jgi:hypothetical protein
MSTDRLQLALIPEAPHRAQPLPADVREKCIELVARILLVVVRPESMSVDSREGRDESR